MAENRPFLERLQLSGYKSIREADLEFTKLNVLIGANGAGKSNLVSFLASSAAIRWMDEWRGAAAGRARSCTWVPG